MPRKLPQKIIEMRGKSHQTKAEKEERSNSEPQLEEIKRLRAPDYLPELLREEFNELGQQLIKAKLLYKLDRDILARYVMSRQAWTLAHQKAVDSLMFDKEPKTVGGWTKIANQYFNQCQSCANAMGLTITSRCKLVVPQSKDEEDNDPMAKMLAERMNRRASG